MFQDQTSKETINIYNYQDFSDKYTLIDQHRNVILKFYNQGSSGWDRGNLDKVETLIHLKFNLKVKISTPYSYGVFYEVELNRNEVVEDDDNTSILPSIVPTTDVNTQAEKIKREAIEHMKRVEDDTKKAFELFLSSEEYIIYKIKLHCDTITNYGIIEYHKSLFPMMDTKKFNRMLIRKGYWKTDSVMLSMVGVFTLLIIIVFIICVV